MLTLSSDIRAYSEACDTSIEEITYVYALKQSVQRI